MLVLSTEGGTVEIDPASGGNIISARLRHGGALVDVLHSPKERPVVEGFAWHGCWPLAPFANRAFGGLMMTAAGPLQLPINDPRNNAAIHGFSTHAAWQIISSDASAATIEHQRLSGGDPYRYVARQTISLEADGALSVQLSVENRAATALPHGLGLHPWFPCDDDTTFQANAGKAMVFGPGYRPTGYGAVDAASDWREPRRPKGGERIANFLDWDGVAMLRYPSRGFAIRIEASQSMRNGLLWTPGTTDFVCFEPQSHAVGAPSEAAAQAAAPLKLLERGETLSGEMRLRLLDL